MTIIIDLLPEETERLAADAHRQGFSLEEYVRGRLAPDKSLRKHKITELEGVGKELWEGIDVRKYLDKLSLGGDVSDLQRRDPEQIPTARMENALDRGTRIGISHTL